jgi:hypothetical protein
MTQLMISSELEHLSTAELRCLLGQIWKDLSRLEQDMPEKQMALALLDNVERALHCRLPHWPRD